MSEPVRPATTRLRSDQGPQADAEVAAATTDELEAIERQRVDWTRLLGASVEPAADLGTLVTHPRPGSSLNFIAGLRWPATGVADRLASVINWMSDRGAWPSVITAEGLSAPADLAARLSAAGWLPVSAERIMFARHPAVVPHLDPGLRVEAVTPASAIDCVRLETASFGLLPEAIGESAEFLATLRGGGHHARFRAAAGGRAGGLGATGARSARQPDCRTARGWGGASPPPARLRPDDHNDRYPRRPCHRPLTGLAVGR